MNCRMLRRGISTCLCGTRMPTTKPAFPGRRRPPPGLYTFLVKDFASAGVEQGENSEIVEKIIDQSFKAAHSVPDGRRFQFATVVVNAMKKGKSPLRIWEEACALIGGNSPTLAVAFVSRPTESAFRTVQEFAGQLSSGGEGGTQQPFSSSSSSPPTVDNAVGLTLSDETAATSSSLPKSSAIPQTSIPSGGPKRAGHVPLIGCVMEDMGGDFESTDYVGSASRTNGRDSTSPVLEVGWQVNSSGEGRVCGARDGLEQEQEADQGRNVGGFRWFSSARGLNSDRTTAEDQDGEEGTLSDWENLCSEYEEAVKVLGSKADRGSEGEEDLENGPVEHLSKDEFLSFLNALLRRREPCEEQPRGGGDLGPLERSEQNAEMHNRQLEESLEMHRDVVAGGEGVLVGDMLVSQFLLDSHVASARHVGHRSESLLGDVEATIVVEPRDTRDNSLGGSGPDVGKQDLNYKLVLCVGHMPGAKAVAFHSATTGLPRLPDLENAVTENNPHMLLLGAPGFVFPEFLQRLATVFPASCRAGAFLAPLFTSKRSQWARAAEEQKSGPLFFGTEISASGAVGLAVAAKEKGMEVPVGAFAEFARMSLGMPRIRGYVFLDEPVSKTLFLPRNGALRHASWSTKGSVGAPSLVLDQLSRRLLKESAVVSQPRLNDVVIDKAKNTIKVDEVSLGSADSTSQQLLSPSPDIKELTSLERLPLAWLDSVLFPGWSMPFYIYEPCYRVMVRQCLEQGKPFGLSSTYSSSWAPETADPGEVIGTLVNLKVHTFERDCRSYIIAHGVRRFRLVNERMGFEPGSFGLTTGQVQFFDDKECESADEKKELLELSERALSLCSEVVTEAQSALGPVKLAHDARLASFAIGHVLDVPTRVKQRWLKMVDTKTRLLEQITFLETKVTSN